MGLVLSSWSGKEECAVGRLYFAASSVLTIILSSILVTSGAAQDAGVDEALMPDHPAAIYEGICEEPGQEARYALTPVAIGPSAATPGAAAGTPAVRVAVGVEDGRIGVAVAAATSQTMIDASLDDLVADPHVIIVQLSAEDPSSIACGTIGGVRIGDELAFGLREWNASGFTGVAVLRDNGDGTTSVTVYLALGLAGGLAGPAGTPAATPTT